MMTPAQIAQARETTNTMAIVIRELPIQDLIATAKPDDPMLPALRAMLGVQAALPPINPNIHRG